MLRKIILPATVALILPLLVVGLSSHGQEQTTLQVSYIDVGQGDSIWLHASDGTDILIDGGPPLSGPTVVAFLQDKGIDDLDVVVLSHADADHSGGLVEVLRSTIPVGSLVYNGQAYSTTTYSNLLTEMQNRGLTPTPAAIGQTYAWGPLNASVLNPQLAPTGSQNEDSVVLLVTFGSKRFLFTGDIGSTTEQTVVASGTPIAADVLKVAHHGSKFSSTSVFLDLARPQLAVISVGAKNTYGEPAQETLDRLEATGAQVIRTDLRGTIVVSTDGQTLIAPPKFILALPWVLNAWLQEPTATPTPALAY